MPVVRVVKKTREFTQINNSVFNDDRISYQALGVLTRLISKPLAWKVQVNEMIREGKNGKTEVYRILEELQSAGYVVKHIGRNAEGRITCTDYTVYEAPQSVEPALVDKLKQQSEKRRQKKQANNSKCAAQPRSAKPEVVPPDLAEAAPINIRGRQKDRSDKKESLPFADAKEPDPLSDPEQQEDWDEDHGDAPTENPEVPHAESVTDIPAASRPEIAADAALAGERRKVALHDPHSPEFPKRGRYPDWCAAVRQFDADNARLMNQLWRVDLFSDNRTARKYYNARYNGRLTSRNVEMVSRFWQEAPINGDQVPRTFWDALDNDRLPIVLSACRLGVKDAINSIQTDGETDDGLSHTFKVLTAARDHIGAETDMLEYFWGNVLSYIAPFFAAFEVGAKNIEAAHVKYREEIIEEISKWPFWLNFRDGYAEYPKILGLTVEEVREHQRRFANEKARGIAELEVYLQ